MSRKLLVTLFALAVLATPASAQRIQGSQSGGSGSKTYRDDTGNLRATSKEGQSCQDRCRAERRASGIPFTRSGFCLKKCGLM
jgi:hypothetical protein